MTFTLFGRWQIRILLLLTVGVILTIATAIRSNPNIAAQTLITLIYLGIFGLMWDFAYHLLQRLRWDGDWNGLLQLAGAVWEAVFLIILIKSIGLPGIDRADFNPASFMGFYTLLSLLNFIVSNSILRIISPYSRFNGGQWF